MKRIIIKIGTNSITYENGKLNLKRIELLTNIISDLVNSGKEVLLVSSGAIGAGIGILNLKQMPKELAMKQATASVGQAHLMQIYQRYFKQNSQNVAQILLTKDVLENPISKTNVQRTINQLFSLGVIPIVNENDTVSTDEIEGVLFSDNDQLSSIVAVLTSADLLIYLTNTDGLLDTNNKLVPEVSVVDKTIYNLINGEKSTFGRGGMQTKLESIAYVMECNIDACILNSSDLNVIYRFLDGEKVGTHFKGVKK